MGVFKSDPGDFHAGGCACCRADGYRAAGKMLVEAASSGDLARVQTLISERRPM